MKARIKNGAGGATRAFKYANDRRIKEIEKIINIKCFPGSLNLVITKGDFDWKRGPRIIGDVSDVVQRPNLDGEWYNRKAYFYPISVNSYPCYAFKFKNEIYHKTFVEVIAAKKLRDVLELKTGDIVEVKQEWHHQG